MSCANLVILFSGFRDDVLKEQIIENGDKVVTIITKNTNAIITKKNGKASKKLEEAKEKDIKIVFLEDFIEEHKFSLAEKKERFKRDTQKGEVVEKENRTIETDINDIHLIDLIHGLTRGLLSKNANDKQVALDALKELEKRVNAIQI